MIGVKSMVLFETKASAHFPLKANGHVRAFLFSKSFAVLDIIVVIINFSSRY